MAFPSYGTKGCSGTACVSSYTPPVGLATAQASAALSVSTHVPPLLDADTGEVLQGSSSCNVDAGDPLFGFRIWPGNSAQQMIDQTMSETTSTAESASCHQSLMETNGVKLSSNALCGCQMCIDQVMGGTGQVPALTCNISQNSSIVEAATASALQKLKQTAGIPSGQNISDECLSQYVSEAASSAQASLCDQVTTAVNSVNVACQQFGMDNTNQTLALLAGGSNPCAVYTQINTGIPKMSCAMKQIVSVSQKASEAATQSTTQAEGLLAGFFGSLDSVGAIVAIVLIVVVIAGAIGIAHHMSKRAAAAGSSAAPARGPRRAGAAAASGAGGSSSASLLRAAARAATRVPPSELEEAAAAV